MLCSPYDLISAEVLSGFYVYDRIHNDDVERDDTWKGRGAGQRSDIKNIIFKFSEVEYSHPAIKTWQSLDKSFCDSSLKRYVSKSNKLSINQQMISLSIASNVSRVILNVFFFFLLC